MVNGVSHDTVTFIGTLVTCHGTYLVLALCLLALSPFRLMCELDL